METAIATAVHFMSGGLIRIQQYGKIKFFPRSVVKNVISSQAKPDSVWRFTVSDYFSAPMPPVFAKATA
jgi:hypothetical protein